MGGTRLEGRSLRASSAESTGASPSSSCDKDNDAPHASRHGTTISCAPLFFLSFFFPHGCDDIKTPRVKVTSAVGRRSLVSPFLSLLDLCSR